MLRNIYKRIIASTLAVITTISLIPAPISVSYAEDRFTGIGEGAGSGGGSASGSWATGKQGYRIYILDSEGNLVSNIIDFTYQDPKNVMSSGLTNIIDGSIKVDPSWLGRVSSEWESSDRQSKFNHYLIDSLKDESGVSIFKNDTDGNNAEWPSAIYYVGDSQRTRGSEIRQWFLKGLSSIKNNSSAKYDGVMDYRPVTNTGTAGGIGETPPPIPIPVPTPTPVDYSEVEKYLSGSTAFYNDMRSLYDDHLRNGYTYNQAYHDVADRMTNILELYKGHPDYKQSLYKLLSDAYLQVSSYMIKNTPNFSGSANHTVNSATLVETYNKLFENTKKYYKDKSHTYTYDELYNHLKEIYTGHKNNLTNTNRHLTSYESDMVKAHIDTIIANIPSTIRYWTFKKQTDPDKLRAALETMSVAEVELKRPPGSWKYDEWYEAWKNSPDYIMIASGTAKAGKYKEYIALCQSAYNARQNAEAADANSNSYSATFDNTQYDPNTSPIPDTGLKSNTKLDSRFNNFLTIAHADDTAQEEENRSNEYSNLVKILEYKDSKTGSYIWKFAESFISSLQGEAVDGGNGSKYKADADGLPSVLETVCAGECRIVVEPLFWFRPAASSKQVDGEWVASGVSNFIYYGTPTGYNRWQQAESKIAGGWVDNGKGGHYSSIMNRNGPGSLYIDKPLVLPVDATSQSEAKVWIQPPSGDSQKPGAKLSRDVVADINVGLAMHYYVCEPGGIDWPEIPTYDRYSPDKDIEHQAPNPDPTLPPETPGLIPLKPTEPPDTYMNYTRTINIVKVYEYEDLLGNRYHVKTTLRRNCPIVVNIQHESNYKVVDWFTSTDLVEAYNVDNIQQVSWDVWSLLPKTEEAPDKEKVTGTVYQEIPWEKVNLDTNVAGTHVHKCMLQIACECELTDPADERSRKHYNDSTVVVKLLYKQEPLETHTWDDENFPDGDPAPAPEPPVLPPPPITTVGVDPDALDPCNINIVKVYRTRDITTNQITHDGTFKRTENPGIILVQDEPIYTLTKYFTSPDYLDPPFSATWEQIEGLASRGALQGRTETKIKVEDPDTTLYVLLEREVQTYVNPDPEVEDLTESQLTKTSNTFSVTFGWYGYKFQASIVAAQTRGYLHCCGSWSQSCGCYMCGCSSCTLCTMSRRHLDDVTSANFSNLSRDIHETTKANASASTEFDWQMYGQGGQIAKDIKFEESGMTDNAYSTSVWSLSSSGASQKGITYITTLSRQSVNDQLHIAQYKKNAMDSVSYSLVDSIFPEQYRINKGVQNRIANGKLDRIIDYSFGHIETDDKAQSACSGRTHYESPKYVDYSTILGSGTTSISGKTNKPDTGMRFKADFDIFTYGGRDTKNAVNTAYEMHKFSVPYPNSKVSKNSSLFTKQQTATVSFFPYVKMSYQITSDNTKYKLNKGLYNVPTNSANSRTVYMLSDKESIIRPTNSVEVSWFNEEQQYNNKYGLQMTSAQWSTHQKATDGSADWKKVDQVLPGGAIYQLNTRGTESYIKTITYNTLVEDSSRSWIKVSDSSKYTIPAIISATQNYLNEAKNVIEHYRLVQWINKDYRADTGWEGTETVKIKDGGERLNKLGLPNSASTDSKYLWLDGSNTEVANEADLDIIDEVYQTIVYKGYTDELGNIYIDQVSQNTGRIMLDDAALTTMVNQLKDMCGTNKSGNERKIGTKDDTKTTIINNIKTAHNDLYILDEKTAFISNLIDSVERNTGNDKLNATWLEQAGITDGRWYNEAFDGYYLVVQTATYKVGLDKPSKRANVLDPNFCPAKSAKGGAYTNAFLSQFRLDEKSTVATSEDKGYLATFEDIKVYIPDLETMYYSRPFYIPNATVQDLH